MWQLHLRQDDWVMIATGLHGERPAKNKGDDCGTESWLNLLFGGVIIWCCFFSNQHSAWSLDILECCTCYLFRYANWKGIFWDKQKKVHHAASSFPGSLLALGVTRSRCPEVAESTWRSDTNEVQKVGGGWGEPQGDQKGSTKYFNIHMRYWIPMCYVCLCCEDRWCEGF